MRDMVVAFTLIQTFTLPSSSSSLAQHFHFHSRLFANTAFAYIHDDEHSTAVVASVKVVKHAKNSTQLKQTIRETTVCIVIRWES